MKITIEFEVDESKLEGHTRKQIKQQLRKGFVDGLGCLVSDYSQGEDYEPFYNALRKEP